MDNNAPSKGPQRVSFLLIPQFPLLSFTAAIEPLRSANRMSGTELYCWDIYSSDGEPIDSSSHITIFPDYAMDKPQDHPKINSLFVCAGINPQYFSDNRTFNWLRKLASHGSQIGGISGGSYVLAHAGLLNNHRCTIHWEYMTSFMEEFPHIDVTTNLFEIDGNRLTSAGASATLDMMLHLIAKTHGHDLSVAVAEQFSHFSQSHNNDPEAPQRLPVRQRLRISNPKLIAVIEQMEFNLEDPTSREELALSVGLTVRQVERLFKKNLNTTPAKYYMDLRLKRARMLLSQTSMSILETSIACGFQSSSHFSKCYRRQYGLPPLQARTQAD